MNRILLGALSLLLLAFPLPSLGQNSVTVGALEISGAFSRATLPNAPVGAGYLTILNTGEQDDRLVSATSPVAGVVQLHEMKMEGDVMKMAELPDGIPVPAGSTVTLQPGGLHIMLMDLNQPLVEGSDVPVTLTFEKAGTIEVQLAVGAMNADQASGHEAHADHAAHAAHGGTHMDMSGMSDVEAITQMQKAMFDTPDSPLEMGPIVVVGEYAISDWAQKDTAGRALLRKTAAGWAIHLCSGAALKDAANLVTIGVPEDLAQHLAHGLAAAETAVDPALLARYDSFDGTMMVDEDLI
jgi:copper(I)-binding protein